MEAELLTQITEGKIEDFIQKSIICRFGLLHTIITDNGRQFDNQKFREYYARLHIRHKLTSIDRP